MRLLRALAVTLAALPLQAAADLGINVYGLSYHFDRARTKALGLDNQINPGLGLRYRVPHSQRITWVADVGAYRDSGRNTALVAGAGALWQVAGGWHVGGALASFKSDSYNQGKAFVAPVPLAAYEFRRATLNFVFTPQWSDVNQVATLAAWLTWWP
jgi:hypothetical protein